jgi:hypothetical protein|nr:MAG TPA: hypothetical protein [Caudoviricetes sp.]
MKTFRLCYIDQNDEYSESLMLYFTEKDPKEQWGDDWDDAPYEHNAGTPYTDDYRQPEQGVENGRGIYPKIEIKKIYIEPSDWKTHFFTPRTGTINSPYSVEDINKGATPWLVVKVDKTIKAIFDARTTYEEFLEKVRKLPIDIYVREEKNYE